MRDSEFEIVLLIEEKIIKNYDLFSSKICIYINFIMIIIPVNNISCLFWLKTRVFM